MCLGLTSVGTGAGEEQGGGGTVCNQEIKRRKIEGGVEVVGAAGGTNSAEH